MDVPGNKFPSMWTVPVLSVGMYKSWTAGDKWTGCPPFAHPHLGQVLDWTIDLTTAPWITARLDVTVNHTDHKLRTRIFLNDLEHRKGTQTDQFLFGDSGFTHICHGHYECENKEAKYCLKDMGAETGYCTKEDCVVEPDDCPSDYSCCDFSIGGIPNFCADEETYNELLELKMCLI
jgi:hypothetical protein